MFWRKLLIIGVIILVPGQAQARMLDDEGNFELEPLFKDKGWDMSAELGMLLTSGNTNSTSILGKVTASHEWKNWRFNYDLNTLLKRDEKYDEELQEERLKTTAERYHLLAQGDYKITEHDAIFALYEYTDDRFASYTEYIAAVVGYSFRALNRQDMKLDLSIGPGYARVLTSEDELEQDKIIRVAANYKWTINDNAQFRQVVSVQTAPFNTRSISETSLTTKISDSMQMKVGFKAVHNTKPQDKPEKLDTETSVTLVLNI